MSTATNGSSPQKKRKENKDGSQPDANGSYPYNPQHFGYPSHGGPGPGGYGYPGQGPPHQPQPPSGPPHYPSGANYGRGPQHPQSYGSSGPPGPPGPNSMYCQPSSEGPGGVGGYPSGPSPYSMGQHPSYSRPPSGMYGTNPNANGGYNNIAGKSNPRSSPTNSIPDGMVRSASTASRKPLVLKEDPNDKGRGSYRCGKCGVPKKGHVCPYQPKLKRRADEPPPEMRNAATQVEMDELLVVRRLNIEIQGFPESYTAAPMDNVGAEARSPQNVNPALNVIGGSLTMSPSPSMSNSMPQSQVLPPGGGGTNMNMNMNNNMNMNMNMNMNGAENGVGVGATCTIGTDPMTKGEASSTLMPLSAPQR